jgi:hypothetical protein
MLNRWITLSLAAGFAISGGSVRAACGAGEFCLATTVGTDLSPGSCATTHAIDATIGEQLNFCYTITNNTGIELDYQKLRIDADDPLFGQISVPNGGTFQYNIVKSVVATNTYDATWRAWDLPSGYSSHVDSSCTSDNYIFADGFDDSTGCHSKSFVDITGSGAPLGLDDDESAAVTLPFAFNLYGAASNTICIDNNGLVLFDTTSCPASGYRTNEDLMFSNLPAPAILPLWDDFDDSSGEVYYESRGAAPNREFVIEWFNRGRFDGNVNPDGPTFEVVLEENGALRFEYAEVSYYTAWNNRTGDATECWSGACATIGLVDSELLFDQFSSYWFAVDNGTSITWAPADLHVFTATDSVTVNVGAPEIAVNPNPLDATVQAGTSTTVSFAVENHGNRDLDWMLNEAPPANFHFPLGPRYAPLTIAPDETDAAAAQPAQEVREHMRTSTAHGLAPLMPATGVPAFGCVIVTAASCDYVSFDANAPGTLDTIATENEVLFGATFAADDFSKEYAIDAGGNLKTIDAATGAMTDIGPTGFGTQMRAIAYDAMTDTLFGTAIDGHGTDLFAIDRNTGAASAIRPITGLGSPTYVMGITVDPYTGLMYGIEIATSSLIAIDKTTGAAGVIGPLGYTTLYSQGLGFDAATGALYLASIAVDTVSHLDSQNMYTVDLYTGHANLIGSIGNDIVQLGAFGIARPAGPCSHPADQTWLSPSSASGTTIPSGSTPVAASIDATGMNAGDVLSGTICAVSNDPAHRMLPVPVTVTVTP